jgi:hypothetical protein
MEVVAIAELNLRDPAKGAVPAESRLTDICHAGR